MATKIIMYTGENCGKCMRAKAMLSSLPSGIELELIEKNIDEQICYKNEAIEKGIKTLPTFQLDNGEMLFGFDENIGKIMEHLGL
jgi:glutaredoxin